jgi:hypothetical protein
MDRSEDDIRHAILLDSDSNPLPSSPPLNLPVRSSPSSQHYHTNRTARPFRTTEVKQEEVNQQIRERVPRPHIRSSSLSTRDTITKGRTIPLPPWTIKMILIRELFYFDTKIDRTDDIKSIYKRTFVGKYLF